MYLFTQVFKEHETIITRGVKLRFTTVFTLLNFCAQSFSQYWRQSSCHNINEASEVEQNRKNGVLIIPLFLHKNHDFRFFHHQKGNYFIQILRFYSFSIIPLLLRTTHLRDSKMLTYTFFGGRTFSLNSPNQFPTGEYRPTATVLPPLTAVAIPSFLVVFQTI